MKSIFLCLALLLCTTACYPAQVTFQWTPSDTPSIPDNPVKYTLTVCSDAGLTQCLPNDAGTKLELGMVMAPGDWWVYATARNFSVFNEGAWTAPQESDKSNVVAVKVAVPPGNPKSLKVKLQ